MNEFDHWVKKELHIKHYGRYVDDFVLIHESKDYLQSIISKLSDYLLSTLKLTLHPVGVHCTKPRINKVKMNINSKINKYENKN
jgi:RNA-directed DNA polymerase